MTSRDQIEGSKGTGNEELDILAEFRGEDAKQPKQLVNLYGEVSPTVLSGLFGVSVANIYSYRRDGKLPPNSDASLRECIKWHTMYWKTRSMGKASSMGEAALVQKIQLDRAKTEQAWLQIKKERGELVEVAILAERFESHFSNMRMGLTALARAVPEALPKVDKLLAEWNLLGQGLMQKSEKALDAFIEQEMEKEVEMSNDEEEEEADGDE